MAELRYNPLLNDYVMVAASRDKRPDMPKGFCPFCIGSGKVPEDYDVYNYPNDFPILSTNPPEPDSVGSDFYRTEKSYGKCDVILYSPDHHGKLWQLSDQQIQKLVRLWADRYVELKADPKIKYILPFENRGAEVGTTMPHPHGQIYAYPFVPFLVREEMNNAKAFYQKSGRSIYDQMIQEERDFGGRIVYENDSFLVFVPFFAQYPYGVYIFNKRGVSSFAQFDEALTLDFAEVLKTMVGSYDALFDKEFPYMMCIYNAPTNVEEYEGAEDFFRFHVKFFPPLRGANSIKWNASSETGAGAFGNPRIPEQTAEELREAVKKYHESK